MSAIEQFWPFGSGIGSFTRAFLLVERLSTVDDLFPNRAHNDYLELAVETGLFAPLLLGAGLFAIGLLTRAAWRASDGDRPMTLFASGVLAVALAACQPGTHSVVPAGDAGYSAIALPADGGTPGRYPLQPGDVVSVQVYGEPELSVNEVALDNAGMLNLPLIGAIRAGGSTAAELSQAVEAAYAVDFMRDPRVTVVVKKAQIRTIAVEGEVSLPGVYPYAEGQTLLTALALARSTTEKAKLDEVMIFRTIEGERMAGRFDIRAIRGGRMPDVALVPGDTVVVGFSGARGAFLDAIRAIPAIGIFRPWP